MGRPDSSAPPSPSFLDDEVADEERTPSPDLPLTMNASVHLADLPQNASVALAADVARLSAAQQAKIVVRFKPVGSAPALQQDICKISSDQKFDVIVRYLRKKLRCKETDSAFLYVNQAFAPSLDEVVGNLHQVGSLIPAFRAQHLFTTTDSAWTISASRMGRVSW